MHRLPRSQSTADPGVQSPPEHTSGKVQALLSSHGSVFGTYTQPVDGLQSSSVHSSASSQTIAVPTQVPSVQISPSVHAFESVHGAVLKVCVQSNELSPVLRQASSVHGLVSVPTQSAGVPATHAPSSHVSSTVQPSLSALHGRVLLVW
jgi:hypothetical protein